MILPGVGAFLAHRVSARYNVEERIFMPPHRTLVFNPQITVDDALLLSEYIACGQYTYEEAGAALQKDIAKLRKELSSKGTLRFGELGTFSMNINGEISFVPGENGIDDPYNFGFEPLVMPLLSDHKKKEIVIKRNDIGKYIATVAAIIIAFFLVAPIGKNSYEQTMQASVSSLVAPVIASSQETVPAIVEDICEIAPVPETVTANIITEEYKQTFTAPTEDETPAQVSVDTTQYYIIVASSPSAENAQLAIKEMSVKLEADYIVVEGSGRYRIAYGSYNSNSDAADALENIRGTFPDAWILTR